MRPPTIPVGMQPTGQPEQTAAQAIELDARLLVAKAEAMGLHVTIERKSVPPLAMRNHVPVITVWERR